jgi:hypothetical protein
MNIINLVIYIPDLQSKGRRFDPRRGHSVSYYIFAITTH